MSRDSSVMAVKRAIGGGESFHGRVDAIVENNGKPYTYSDIFASVTYNVGYMQMNVSLDWDDDRRQKSYEKLEESSCNCSHICNSYVYGYCYDCCILHRHRRRT